MRTRIIIYQLSLKLKVKVFFTTSTKEYLLNNENWYFGVNKNKDLNLNKFYLNTTLKKGKEYKIRVKVEILLLDGH